MSTLQHIRLWSSTHHPRWLVILRMALGLILLGKGIQFIYDSTLLEELIYRKSHLAENSTGWLPILITWANLLGGFMLTVGLWTRVVALLEIPILIGAIIDINTQRSGSAPATEPAFAIVALLLLIFFLIEGGGPLSLDGYFERNRGEETGTKVP